MRRSLYEPDHEAYRASVAEFLAREVVPFQDDWNQDRWIDRTVYARAAKAGIYAPRAYLDTRVQTIYGGTTEIMKEIIGRDIAGVG